jgi:hypothetical protein
MTKIQLNFKFARNNPNGLNPYNFCIVSVREIAGHPNEKKGPSLEIKKDLTFKLKQKCSTIEP